MAGLQRTWKLCRKSLLVGWVWAMSPHVFIVRKVVPIIEEIGPSRDKAVPALFRLTPKRGSILSWAEGTQPAGMTFSLLPEWRVPLTCQIVSKISCMQGTEPEQNHWDHNQLTLISRLVNLLVTPMNRARLSSTESDGYRLWLIHQPLNTIRLVCSRGNLHSLSVPHLFDYCKGGLMPKVDGWGQFRDCSDRPACHMLAPQP